MLQKLTWFCGSSNFKKTFSMKAISIWFSLGNQYLHLHIFLMDYQFDHFMFLVIVDK